MASDRNIVRLYFADQAEVAGVRDLLGLINKVAVVAAEICSFRGGAESAEVLWAATAWGRSQDELPRAPRTKQAARRGTERDLGDDHAEKVEHPSAKRPRNKKAVSSKTKSSSTKYCLLYIMILYLDSFYIENINVLREGYRATSSNGNKKSSEKDGTT
ncbi:hypothetical protein E2562_033841 [Oryza meyeriana var. granulata]|uniref:Uncharacterized protein n=1 Tax=Oryza meyeriana var. granulata TaxID=110450 RepID=A0A6G1BNB6_9ORYZ|nr:hypothetical protein E2562_033841 [Oryza meyeriana var. granulata]